MGRVLEEVLLQGLCLTGSGLILAGYEGYHVVERSHFHGLPILCVRYHVLLGCWDYALVVCRGGLLAWFGLGLGTVVNAIVNSSMSGISI